ncbi:MAG: hypothetical protein DRZ76_01860 [Candidatus Nealsonbacteria bacterium]|nr:MAG: hypothetical protein DRZ76_01860 [Candidatus Nealsonbacteria bacterium]
MKIVKVEPIKTKTDLIKECVLNGLDNDGIMDLLSLNYPDDDYDKLLNHIGVIRHQLRKEKRLPTINHRILSRHKLTIKYMTRGETNTQILKRLKKKFPEIEERKLKQRICEYRWHYRQGKFE